MAAMNPMQKKANTSFMIGVLITLLITGAIIAFLVVQLMNIRKEQAAAEQAKQEVYVLTQDVKSGETIDGKYEKIKVDPNVYPGNASELPASAIAKVDLFSGAILTASVVTEQNLEELENMKLQEYNMIVLPSQLQDGDYIDIRLRLPSGLDFIVVSKKQVTIPVIGGSPSSTTIQLHMTEEETLSMSSAIIDYYIMEGSMLYATIYTEPGEQEATTITYPVSEVTKETIKGNPNVAETIRETIEAQWQGMDRNGLEDERAIYSSDALSNIESGVSEQVSKALEERKAYLDALAGE